MMIERNRPDPTPGELAQLYAQPNDADRWPEHALRVNITVELARYRFHYRPVIIDPAAGAGRTVRELIDDAAGTRIITGDLAPEANVTHAGTDAIRTLELALEELGGWQPNAVVILGEVLEHVPDPEALLSAARHVAGGLVLSTPLAEPAGINPEHLWRWDKAGVYELLDRTAWRPLDYLELDADVAGWPHPCRTQLHTAEARP